ncbi:MAG: nicotinate (nicotinamide) nucleotide adenylyltransferase [Treponemataceae bacterium]
MKYAMLGGTFNPIHIGHLCLAEQARVQFGFEKIIFVPTFLPPHKNIQPLTGEVRLQMIKKAISSNPYFCVDSCELERKGLSYTIDTIAYLQKKYSKGEKISLIMGDDLIDDFYLWKDANILADQVDIILAHRNFVEESDFFVSNKKKYPCRPLNNAILPICSSDIRRRLTQNESIRYLVSDSVYDYIVENNLYREEL